jgi:peptide chain release factor subunit 3
MSRLNAKAFEFVPGQSFKLPTQFSQQQQQQSEQSDQQTQPQLQPIERPAQTESPKPPPTISLNIGSSKPVIQPTASKPPPRETPSSKLSAVKEVKTASPPVTATATSSTQASTREYNFSSEKSKTDADAIIAEQQAKVDSATIADLYGDSESRNFFQPEPSNMMLNLRTAKQHLNIVFIGHVDAGKSTMGGNLLYLTGTVDKRTMEKYEREAKEAGRESWYLSWALDSTPQERAKVGP